jgi:putative ABC transport system ATP-binding protein
MNRADHAVIELDEAGRSHSGSPVVHALRSASLTIHRAELVAVIGPSGSGKSTMLNLLGTLERPTSGRVLIDGDDVAHLDDRHLAAVRSRHIGFVFQQFMLLDRLSALDNVAIALLYRGTVPRTRRARAAAALDRVGLAGRLHHRPGELSGGEQQRVAIARAIVGDPAVLLADEPTGNLDSDNSQTVIELLTDLQRDGASVVVVTHDNDVAAHFPRQIALRDGIVERDAAMPRTPS